MSNPNEEKQPTISSENFDPYDTEGKTVREIEAELAADNE